MADENIKQDGTDLVGEPATKDTDAKTPQAGDTKDDVTHEQAEAGDKEAAEIAHDAGAAEPGLPPVSDVKALSEHVNPADVPEGQEYSSQEDVNDLFEPPLPVFVGTPEQTLPQFHPGVEVEPDTDSKGQRKAIDPKEINQ